jgi:CHAT domain-containing protein/Tfp pilus assembly protein PilF
VNFTINGGIGMIHPHSRSTQGKYRLWVVYCGLVLSAGLPLIQIQASPEAIYNGKEVKSGANVVSIEAQENQQTRQLELGKPIERKLAGDQSHSYQMTLAAGQYVKLVVEQRGIDVKAKLFGADGKQIIEFDSTIRTQGQEIVSWVAEEAGSYRVDVVAKFKNAAAEQYEIQLVELRVATDDDRALHEAYKLSTEFIRLYVAGKYDEAHPLAERALEKRERLLGPEHPDIAESLNQLAGLYYTRGIYAKAETLFQRALNIEEKVLGAEHTSVAQSYNYLAVLYDKKGDYAKAMQFHRRALNIREKVLGPEHSDVAISLNNLGRLYYGRGDYAMAEPLYQRALAIWEKALGPEHSIVAATLSNLAVIYSDRSNYSEAEMLYQRALTIEEKVLGPEHPAVAQSLNNLAILYEDKGDYARAAQFYERALNIREKVLGPEHPDVAISLNNLAAFCYVRGDYAKAEPLYQRALAIWEKALGPEHPEVATYLNNLAEFYAEIGNYAKAESLYQRALAIQEKVLRAEHSDFGSSLSGLASLYSKRGDYAKAEPLFQRALSVLEKSLGPENPKIAESLTDIATLYRKRGDYTKAEPLYQRALTIWEKALGSEYSDVAINLIGLALLHAAKGDIAQAVAFLSRSNAVDEHNFALNLAIGSEREKLVYLSLFTERTDLTISLQSQAGSNDQQALDLAFTTLLRRKGRGLDAMTDTIATLRRHATPQDRELFDKLKEARSQLAALTLKGPDAAKPDAYRSRLKELEVDVDKLEGELSSRSAEFRANTQPVTLAAVQAALPAGSALVEFAVYSPLDPKTEKSNPPRYVAYLLAAQGRPKWVDLGEVAQIDRAVEAWRKALRNPNRTDVKRLARAVDERVMRPVRSLLDQMPGERRLLLIAPDGSLNLIPFAALVDERNRYLAEHYSISYLTSGRDLLRLQSPEPSKTAPLVVANPLFGTVETLATQADQNAGKSPAGDQANDLGSARNDPKEVFFQALPGTNREALAIKAILPQASLLLRDEATESALKQARAPSILHIATHGFFLEDQEAPPADTRRFSSDGPLRTSDPRLMKWAAKIENPLLRSGLALAGVNQHHGGDDDGLLTALEAASLDLWGTKLVVLSACDTGIGKVKNGEGVYGLRRALVLAGSETQVISLWPVSDRETRGLMAGYYRRLQKGEGRSEALRQIQLEMLKDPKLQHPYYWASFIQAGEWANLDGRR